MRRRVLSAWAASVLLGALAIGAGQSSGIRPPPGVPAADVTPRENREAAQRLLAEVIAQLGSKPPAADGPSVAPLDPESDQAKEVAKRAARGAEALAQNKGLKAIPDFEAAVAIDPGNPELLRSLAQAYTQIGNEQRALAAYERLLLLRPDDAQALVATGTAEAARRHYDEAVRRVAAGLESSAKSSKPLPAVTRVIAHRVLAGALRELECDAASAEAWTRAIAALDEIDIAQAQEPPESRQDLSRARAELLLARADARVRLGEADAALADLDAIRALPGIDPHAVLPRELFVLEMLGRGEDADARLAVALEPVGVLTHRKVALAQWLVERSPDRPKIADAARRAVVANRDSLAAAELIASVDPQAGVGAFRTILATRAWDSNALRGLFALKALEGPDALAESLVDRTFSAPEHGLMAVQAALATSISERSLREALARQPESAARTAALARLALLGRDFALAWDLLAPARAKQPDDVALATAQIETAGALVEPGILLALERGQPGTPGGLPAEPAVALALAKALRAAADADESLARLEHLAEEGRVVVDSPLARALADRLAGLPRNDPGRTALAERAIERAESALAQDPADEDAALVLLRLRDPRPAAGSAPRPPGPDGPVPASPTGDAEAWAELRAKLREGPLAWLDERVTVEEETLGGLNELALARLLGLAADRPFDSELVGLAVNRLVRAGRANEAVEWLDRELARRPALISLRDARVSAAAQAGQAEEYAKTLRAAIEADPGDALAAWHYEALLRALQRGEEANERSRARLLARPEGVRRSLELANLEQRSDRPADALAALQSVRDADRLTREQRFAAVEIASRLPPSIPGRSELIIALAEPGVAFGDADVVLYAAAASMGILDEARGGSKMEEREAIARVRTLAERAAATDPGSSDELNQALRWRDAAQLFVDADAVEAAAEFLRPRLADPTSLPAVALRALASAAFACDARAGDRVDRSIELLRALRSKGVRPFDWTRTPVDEEADALVQLSALYSIAGDRAGSERILEAALELRPQHAMALNNLAWARVERGVVDARTVDLAERALAGSPGSAPILDTVGWIRYLQGRLEDDPAARFEGALTLLRRSSLLNEKDPSLDVIDHLGDAYWAAGDREAAKKAWREVVRIAAQNYERTQTLPQLNAHLFNECGLRLVDPEAFYDEHFGNAADRASKKLLDLDAGRTPAVTPPLVRSSADEPPHP